MKQSCKNCQEHFTIGKKHACKAVPLSNKKGYKILKTLDICDRYWPVNRKQKKREVQIAPEGVLVISDGKGGYVYR